MKIYVLVLCVVPLIGMICTMVILAKEKRSRDHHR